jgi:two-component system cell cycle sensor histidine kinase/response regulator CckA
VHGVPKRGATMGLDRLLERDDIPPDVRETIARALTERRGVHKQVAVQRDLAIGLLEAPSLREALSLGIETALSLADLDAGAVCLTDEAAECMTLTSSQGLSKGFLKQASCLELTPERTRQIASGGPVYIARQDVGRLIRGSAEREGLTAIAVIPLLHRGRAFGTLCVASRSLGDIPVASRQPLETIAAIVANAVARFQAEQALRESERRYALATSAGKVGVWEWDTETGKLTGDHILRDMLGYSRDEVPDHVDGLRQLIHPDDVPGATEDLRAHRERRTPRYEATYRGVHRNGSTHWFVARGSPLPDEAGKPRRVVGTTVDVTELKEAEEERRRLEERIRRGEQLERLRVFVGGLAHDFRNIISGIVNNASHALDALPQDGEARTAVEHIEAAAKRAAELSGEMLAYAGRGKSDTQPLDLSKLVEQAVHLAQSSIPNNVMLLRELAADLPAVEGDATQLRHVAMNLVTNAAEAIPHSQEGTVTVTTGVREVDELYLSHTYLDDALRGGRYVYLEVADTGCGMNEADQARAFDPFFSTKPEGRGLGLAAVLGVVRGHHGAIDVASEPGRGTTITVLLPESRAAPSPVELSTAEKASAGDDWQGSGTVLFAEDEPISRWAGKLSLEKAGFTVLLARNGREAVDLFREHAESIVAVILDGKMPELSGQEAFEELCRTHPGTRAIVVSGTEEEEDVRRAFGDGLAGFVPKPHSPSDLIAAVRRSLGE